MPEETLGLLKADKGPPFYFLFYVRCLHTGQSADVLWKGNSIGWFGQLHPQISQQLDLPTTWVAQLDMQALLDMRESEKTIIAPSKFPQVRRDIAILVDKNVSVQDILANIRQVGGELLKDSWLFDVYEGERLPEGKRSLAFGLIFQDFENTLADEAVNEKVNAIVNNLAQNFDAKLRD